MEFRILGPLEVLENGASLDLGGHKQRALLAVLLLHANEVVSTDRLIDALWEDAPPERAQKAVQVYVSGLRKALGRERLETRAPGYLLRVEDEELDLDRFQRLVQEGKPKEALALWRGEPLSDFAYSRFARAEAARLQELRLGAIEERVEQDLAAGRHAAVIGELEALVREQPLRERLRAQLMLALYRSGRQAEALDAYQDTRRVLSDELGLEPSRELRELQQAILNQDPALDVEVAVQAPETEATRGVFVGREVELTVLRDALDDAVAGRGRLLLLVGEPGIGKSRLAEELIAHAQGRGARAIVGRCWEAGGAPAYWPWVQALRASIEGVGPEALSRQLGPGAAELAELVPELREIFPDLPERPMLESESARFRLFEAISSFLRGAATSRPLVLVLDDLHAADEPSLLLLRFLAREVGNSRVLVVGAYRDVDPSPADPLTTALTELLREPVTTRLRLSGLDEQAVRDFIERISGEAPSRELVAAIYEETEGNPLFVGEIVRLLAAEGRLEEDAPRLVVPQSVRDVITRRLRHLSDECNRVLVLAAVLGREFGLDALAGIAEISNDELLEALDEAMAARLVSDVPDSPRRLRFAHVLIRDALYEGLTTVRRVRLHRQAFEALEALQGDEPSESLAELAYHSIAGSDFAGGVRYARRAGDRALELLAYEEATRLYATALEALDLTLPADPRVRCELLLSLGEAEARAGNSPAARSAFLDAAGLARRLGLAPELAQAAAGYGGRTVYGRAGGDTRLVPLLEEGLAALSYEDVELRARLLARLAGALRDEHSRKRRDEVSREAVELARRSGDLSALGYALDGRGAAINAPDTIDECLALGTELCDVARRISDDERVAYGHVQRFIAELNRCDIEGAEADLEAAAHIAEELGQPTLWWQVTAGRAMLALAAGRFGEAEDLAARALAFGERAHDWLAVPVYWLQRYQLYDLRGGDEVDFEMTIAELAERYPARSRFFRAVLAHRQARLGRLAEAEATVDELSADDFSELPFDMEWLFATSLLAEAIAVLGDAQSASVLYRLLHPWRALNVVDMAEGIRGSVSRYVGLLAATSNRLDDAEEHFRLAIEANQRMGFHPWLALTEEDYGRMLLARGEDARGRELLGQALATYRELGMERALARAGAKTKA